MKLKSIFLSLVKGDINSASLEKIEVLGSQENALQNLCLNGGLDCLVDPTYVHKLLEFSQLTINRLKKSQGDAAISVKDAILNQSVLKKRESLLDAALRYGRLPKLRAAFQDSIENSLAY